MNSVTVTDEYRRVSMGYSYTTVSFLEEEGLPNL
jgi:hypothetical protein